MADASKGDKRRAALPGAGRPAGGRAEYRPARVVGLSAPYVVFYAPTFPGGPLKRYRKRCALKGYDQAQRLAYAQEYARQINEQLRAGWTPAQELAQVQELPLGALVERYLATKGRQLRPQSFATMSSMMRPLQDWLRREGLGDLPASKLRRPMATAYLDELASRGLSPDRYNQCLAQARRVMRWAQERGLVEQNPFEGIRGQRSTGKKRRLFEADELRRLFAWARANDAPYYLACLVVYRTWIRPGELMQLRVRDFELQRRRVRVPAQVAKAGRERFPVLPDDVLQPLAGHLQGARPSDFAFGAVDLRPGSDPAPRHTLGERFRRRVRKSLGFDGRLVFYSLKDTGITHFLQAGGALGDAQYQAGHASPEQTVAYVGTNAETIRVLRSWSQRAPVD